MSEGPGAVLIAGATATGKSALALRIARERNGVIINTDSMQVYDVLRILSARPDKQARESVRHLLYGHVSPARAYSVADWLADVKTALRKVTEAGQIPVFVGGTGLYFNALVEGLSQIPQPDPSIRKRWREVAKTEPDSLHAALKKRDPSGASNLHPSDTQRIARALEVFDSTGVPLSHWTQNTPKAGLLDGWMTERIVMQLPREELHRRINTRFDLMLKEGALDEVARLAEMDLAPNLPAMKAIGVPQLLAYLRGEQSLEDAGEKAKAASRQYAKRQMTWFRSQFGTEWKIRNA